MTPFFSPRDQTLKVTEILLPQLLQGWGLGPSHPTKPRLCVRFESLDPAMPDAGREVDFFLYMQFVLSLEKPYAIHYRDFLRVAENIKSGKGSTLL